MNLPFISLLQSGNMYSALSYLVSVVIIVFLVLPVHEFSHAFSADRLGDKTARYHGRLTLNPMAHIDWFGAVMILLVGFGWAKPVPINASRFKKPKWGMALTALCGPLSNLIMGFLSMVLFSVALKIIFVTDSFTLSNWDFVQSGTFLSKLLFTLCYIFSFMASINIGLAVFNLIPIPPLDGSRLLTAFLPDRIYFKVMQYERFIMLSLMLLLFTGVLSGPLSYLRHYTIRGMGHLVATMFGFDGPFFNFFISWLG